MLLRMEPACGGNIVRYVGDVVRFVLEGVPDGCSARIRTNIGRGKAIREGIISSVQEPEVQLEACWRDVSMSQRATGFEVSFVLSEVGWFQAKAYVIDSQGAQHWPEGDNIGVSVHPNSCRTANTIYCAFPRMFGRNKHSEDTQSELNDPRILSLDEEGYTVIPSSGTFRSLKSELPHIIDKLGCKILHLLPVGPVPTTYARMGRFGSPYACGDLTSIDPALVEFDKRTTGVEQFCELTDAVHGYGAQVFIDLAINHTGWGSTLQNDHPDWFLRESNGDFASPGAWGVTWGDLVELDPQHNGLWEHLADAFLAWCRRGVDGFRCDAGYKVPMRVWRYIIARVREEFPDTIFLLEGLGGGWEATSDLLTQGGMQWAYSELFQEYDGPRVAAYLDHAHTQSRRVGSLIHYSETHDNERLSAKGKSWSLMRNRLCALAGVNGGYGFTNGVEWLAQERVNVHSARGLNWGAGENIVDELAALNALLVSHPCFFDGAKLTRISSDESSVYALSRKSSDSSSELLVLVNLDTKNHQQYSVNDEDLYDLVSNQKVKLNGGVVTLDASQVMCLSIRGGMDSVDLTYQNRRAQAAWAFQCLACRFEPEEIGVLDWEELAGIVARDPESFLSSIQYAETVAGLLESICSGSDKDEYPMVSIWRPSDVSRVFPLPEGHWLLVVDSNPFRVSVGDRHAESVQTDEGHVAAFCPDGAINDYPITLRPLDGNEALCEGIIKILPESFQEEVVEVDLLRTESSVYGRSFVLLTNGRGGMARMAVDLGRIESKYDCLLAANLHENSPVDRHIFAKRVRAWAVADGLISPLNIDNLLDFKPGPPACWRFLVSAGDSRAVEIELTAQMIEEENTTQLFFSRPDVKPVKGRALEEDRAFTLSVRVDIEDRNFHSETQLDDGACRYFEDHLSYDMCGFVFKADENRQLSVVSDGAIFHSEIEWCRDIPHPLENSRGQKQEGDACSPGWFEVSLTPGGAASIHVSAESGSVRSVPPRPLSSGRDYSSSLKQALHQFLVRRGSGKTVIAGYPWFLDWGRDTFIAARGLLSAGWKEEVIDIVRTFARLEQGGTLPNSLNGDNDSNRETSDAPLWFSLVSEELGEECRAMKVQGERTLADVLVSIGQGYRDGAGNGVRMDPESALIWSPAHYTWMDTNYPAGTPREGYPVEIQALWIRLLNQLERLDPNKGWLELSIQATASLRQFYGGNESMWLADNLQAESGVSALNAVKDTSLRPNGLIAVALGVVDGLLARKTVLAAKNHLIIPGAIRTLAPLKVELPLEIRDPEGGLLNDPLRPYWGTYQGEEDTRRKPAYHNGTAWGWPFPVFCEALVKAWGGTSASVGAARSYLLSTQPLLNEGCLGQLPEIIDGDAPHINRGCDAQAWSVSEALRVWNYLNEYEQRNETEI